MSTDSNAQTLSEAAEAGLAAQRQKLSSAGNIPLTISPVAEFTPLNLPQEQKTGKEIELKTHEVEGGLIVYEIPLSSDTKPEFSLNTEDATLPALIKGRRADDSSNWKVADVTVMPDVPKVNFLHRIGLKKDLDKGLQDQLPQVGDEEGVNLRIDQFIVGENSYATFFARIYSAQTASTDAPMRSVYFYITRDPSETAK